MYIHLAALHPVRILRDLAPANLKQLPALQRDALMYGMARTPF